MARLNRVGGTKGNDLLIGTVPGDRMQGLPGDDILIASPGDDNISGGRGYDIVQYQGTEVDSANVVDYFSVLGYDITFGKRGMVTIVDTAPGIDGNTGTDSLSGVEE